MAQKKDQQESGATRGGRDAEREALTRRGSPLGELSPWGGSPFRRALAEMDWMFDQMQRSFFGAPWAGSGERMLERAPRLDMEDTGDAIVLRAEVPGLDPKDLQVDCREGVLTIRGESRHEEGERDRGRYERSYSSYYRQIPLPPDVDVDEAQASCRNGVLTIRFRKGDEATNVKRIPITTGGEDKQQREEAA
jgi:HSP20 family protein